MPNEKTLREETETQFSDQSWAGPGAIRVRAFVSTGAFPNGMPPWLRKVSWLSMTPWDLYRGRGVELLVSPVDPNDREEFDTPLYSVSWGVVNAMTPAEELEKFDSEESIGCSGTVNTENWGEALDCLRIHSAC